MIYYKIKAFTLIELLVGIAIIFIVGVGFSNFNMGKLSNNLKLEKSVNGIQNHYEEIRNNALIGKPIGVNLDVPDNWKIEFGTSGSGVMNSSYTGSFTTGWENYKSQDLTDKLIINKIECFYNNNSTAQNDITNGTGTIFFNRDKISLGGDCDDNTSRIKISVGFFGNNQSIEINTLNGLFKATKNPL